MRVISPEHSRVDASSMHWHGDWRLKAIFAVGAVLAILCALLRTWATAYLRSDVVHDPAMHTQQLVADGPYRHVRNPLYLGTVFLAIGIGLMASRLGFVVLQALIWLFNERLIRREEAALRRELGERFDAYCAKVPRLLFSPWPRLPRGGGSPKWGQALLGESFSWAFALQLCVFAITLNLVYSDIACAVGFALAVTLRQTSHRLVRADAVT